MKKRTLNRFVVSGDGMVDLFELNGLTDYEIKMIEEGLGELGSDGRFKPTAKYVYQRSKQLAYEGKTLGEIQTKIFEETGAMVSLDDIEDLNDV